MEKDIFESVIDKKISIRFDSFILNENEEEEEKKIFELKRSYEKMDSSSDFYKLIAEHETQLETAYLINEERDVDYYLLKEQIDEYGGNFCFDLTIYSGDKKIGAISLTRVFVDNKSDVIGFIDCESPQSLDIAHYICNTDFDKVYDSYVAIYDCFVLDEEYQGIGLEKEILCILDSFLIECEFDISRIYIKAVSISYNEYSKNTKSEKMLEILKDNEYQLVDNDNLIMYSDCWDFEELENYID